jgi:hypothetical protein
MKKSELRQIIKEEISKVLRENEMGFPSENEIKANAKRGKLTPVSRRGQKYEVYYGPSSDSDDFMSFGVYTFGGVEDDEQLYEFYSYKELLDWLKGKSAKEFEWS